jgi:hypothetical protein
VNIRAMSLFFYEEHILPYRHASMRSIDGLRDNQKEPSKATPGLPRPMTLYVVNTPEDIAILFIAWSSFHARSSSLEL